MSERIQKSQEFSICRHPLIRPNFPEAVVFKLIKDFLPCSVVL